MRRMSIGALWICAALLPGIAAARCCPGDSACTCASATWRLQADPFRTATATSVGLFRRTGPRHDLGLLLSTDWNESDDHSTSTTTDTQNPTTVTSPRDLNHGFTIDGGLVWRRWRRMGERLGWYLGPMARLEYSRSSESAVHAYADYTDFDTYREHGYTGEIRLDLGAEIRLLPRLALTVDLNPIGASYSWDWTDSSDLTVDTSPSRVDSHQSQGRTRSGGLNVRLTPEFFLTLDL